MSAITLTVKLRYDDSDVSPATAMGWWLPFAPSSHQDVESDTNVESSSAPLKSIVSICRQPDHGRLFQVGRDLVWLAGNTTLPPIAGAIALRDHFADATANTQLWHPACSQISPNLSADLVLPSFPEGSVSVWLPSAGLIRLEHSDEIRPSNFFHVANPKSETWSRPPAADVAFPQINQLTAALPPEVMALLVQSNEDIGSQSEDLNELGKENGVGSVGRIREWILNKLKNSLEGENDSQTNRPNGGISLRQHLLDRINRGLQEQRQRSLDKLLKMFKDDPDRALQFAIPLASDNGYRGHGQSGGDLRRSSPDFSLTGLRSGGIVDFWDVDYERQMELQKSYREQANREATAGRHRRAAYIAAHLLGDFQLAATMLEQGGHHAEAAVLYRDRLRKPRDYARCLELAGQWEIAGQAYREIGEHELAGEVYLRADANEEAESAFREAVSVHLSHRQPIQAAKLLDVRLDARDEALELLRKQWPSGNDAVESLHLSFRWLGESGNHALSEKLLESIDQQSRPTDSLALAKVAEKIASEYPNESMKALAEDLCRISLSRDIESVSNYEREQRISVLNRLTDSEGQLRRDGQRFLESFYNVPTGQIQERQPKQNGIRLERELSLDVGQITLFKQFRSQIVMLAGNEQTLYYTFNPMLLNQQQPMENVKGTFVPLHAIRVENERYLVTPTHWPIVYVCGEAKPVLSSGPKEYPPIVYLADTSMGIVEDAVYLPNGVVAGLQTDELGMNLRFANQYSDASCAKPATFFGQISTTGLYVPKLPDESAYAERRLYCVGSRIFLSVGGLLMMLDKNGECENMLIQSSEERIRDVDTSLPATRDRLVAVTDVGITIFRLDLNDYREEQVADGDFLKVKLLHGGRLTAVSDDEVHVWQANRKGYANHRSVQLSRPGRDVIEIIRNVNHFRLIHRDGMVASYTIE